MFVVTAPALSPVVRGSARRFSAATTAGLMNGLVPVRVECWGPFVFVNLDQDAPSLAETLGAIPDETHTLPLERMSFYKRVDYELHCNWKVYVDNYLEGYHIPMAHPGLFKEINYNAYRVETARYYSKQHAPIRPRPDSLYRRHLAGDAPAQALYYWVFPNLMLNIYPDNLQILCGHFSFGRLIPCVLHCREDIPCSLVGDVYMDEV